MCAVLSCLEASPPPSAAVTASRAASRYNKKTSGSLFVLRPLSVFYLVGRTSLPWCWFSVVTAAPPPPPTSQFRLEHAVSMQTRGLLRYPLAVEPPPTPLRPTSSSAASHGQAGGDGGAAPPSSLGASPLAAGGPAESMAGGGGGNDPDDMATGEEDDVIPGAAEFEDDDSALEDMIEPPAGDSTPASAQSATATAAVAAAVAEAAVVEAAAEAQPEASPSSPRLEEWPGFPCPSKAFARAAAIENPKGLLPPSPDVLRFIHQVMRCDAT